MTTASTPSPSLARNWGAVILLTLVGVLNIVDRFLPAILAEPIKHDLMLSDAMLGFINGFGFLAVYAIMGIPIARLADRGNYGLVISGCVTLWSFMTALGGLAQAGWQLALTRMGVAVGEAGNTPAAHAYISRNFPPNRRAAPLSVLSLSIPIAGTVGLMAGGLLGEAFGWRITFVIMGLGGILLAPLVLYVLGARQSTTVSPAIQATVTSASSWAEVGKLLKKRTFMLIMFGSSCVAIGGYTLTTFAPAFLMRVHGMSLSEVGPYYGVITGVMGILGLAVTGALADKLSTRDPRWVLWVVVIMILILLPCAFSAFFVSSKWVAMALVGLTTVIATAYMAPVVAAIQRLTPVNMRASASAILLFFSAMAGGVGPLAAGMLSDMLQPELGPLALARALLIVPAAHLLACILYAVASLTFRQDMINGDD